MQFINYFMHNIRVENLTNHIINRIDFTFLEFIQNELTQNNDFVLNETVNIRSRGEFL